MAESVVVVVSGVYSGRTDDAALLGSRSTSSTSQEEPETKAVTRARSILQESTAAAQNNAFFAISMQMYPSHSLGLATHPVLLRAVM